MPPEANLTMRNKLSLLILCISAMVVVTQLASAQSWDDPFPKLERVPKISIPDIALEAGISGEVSVRVQVDRDGNVSAVEHAYGPGPICRSVTRADVVAIRSAALEAAKQAKFKPRKKNQKDWAWIEFQIPGTGEKTSGEKLERFVLSPKTPELRDKIMSLPKPPYPPAARVLKASGPVSVELVVDEDGNVFSSKALSGHPLLRAAGTQSGCSAKFHPLTVDGKPSKSIWIITYNFVP
jgi:hypothetical protein